MGKAQRRTGRAERNRARSEGRARKSWTSAFAPSRRTLGRYTCGLRRRTVYTPYPLKKHSAESMSTTRVEERNSPKGAYPAKYMVNTILSQSFSVGLWSSLSPAPLPSFGNSNVSCFPGASTPTAQEHHSDVLLSHPNRPLPCWHGVQATLIECFIEDGGDELAEW